MAMARQLVEEMSSSWSADQFCDSFQAEVMKLVQTKALAGRVEQVEKIDAGSSAVLSSANVGDLTELLQRSLAQSVAPKASASRKAPSKERVVRKKAA